MAPLANAWRSGAGAWTTDRRGDFANDPHDPQLGRGLYQREPIRG